MSSILQEIESQIAGVKTSVIKQNVGVVREIGDGVAKVEGLADAMLDNRVDPMLAPVRPSRFGDL